MGPPSNYPDFKGLVRRIASGTGRRHDPKEPIDRFLGRLRSDGVEVHKLTKELLTNPKSRPNPLHKSIAMLLASSGKTRLVTTNFDRHFTTELEAANGAQAEVYSAPALPVGHSFEGLVYLHGSVDGPADRLVLTDSDFGRAYITDGWASKFLRDVYSEFVVLFVGYSHDDTVMQYLARGLPPGRSNLFALTTKRKVNDWIFLGITPIPYPVIDSGDRHGVLRESMSSWTENATMGALDHEQRVKALLNGPPLVAQTEEDDYLRSVVEDVGRMHFFVRNAQDPEWLRWANDRGLLKDLFHRQPPEPDGSWMLAQWFARFALNRPRVALAVFEGNGQEMNPVLWTAIAQAMHSETKPRAESMTAWLPILMDQSAPEVHHEFLEYLFEKARAAGSWPLVLRLFEHLTRPQLMLEKGMAYYGDTSGDTTFTGGKIFIRGSHYSLNKAVDSLFKPNLGEIATDLLRIGTHNIWLSHVIGKSHGISDDDMDSLSTQRAAIEPHQQNQLPRDFDPLIDACRDSIEYTIRSDHSIAMRFIDEWAESPAPLLRRLAIDGMRRTRRISASKKLIWVVKNRLLDSLAAHHELFQLVKSAYPGADLGAKRDLLNEARAATSRKIKRHGDSEPDIYWRSLLRFYWWLHDATDGKCKLVGDRLRRLRKKYPEAQQSEHPDFLYWLGEVKVGYESPKTSAELAEMDVEDTAEYILNFDEGKRLDGPTREGLLHELSSAVKQVPLWGVELCRSLLKRNPALKDFWWHIYWGWIESELGDAEWDAVLSVMDGSPRLRAEGRVAAWLLAGGVGKGDYSIPKDLMAKAEGIGIKVWAEAVESADHNTSDSNDWVTTAINNPGGNLAEFFVSALSLRRKASGARWRGIPRKYKTLFEEMLSQSTLAGEMATVILVGQLQFFYVLEADWATEFVLPRLSWRSGQRRATQAWHGFLFYGRWHDDLLRLLLPHYQRSFGRLDADLRDVRERFIRHVASFCLISKLPRVRRGFINKFLTTASSSDRVLFVQAVTELLQELGSARADEVWSRWLGEYWSRRLVGKPVPLESDEASKMVEWAPHLGKMFPEAVSRVRESSVDRAVGNFVYHVLRKNGIPGRYPEATADLVKVLVLASYEPMLDYGDLGRIIRHLADEVPTNDALRTILTHMLSKGSTIAGEILLNLDKADGASEAEGD